MCTAAIIFNVTASAVCAIENVDTTSSYTPINTPKDDGADSYQTISKIEIEGNNLIPTSDIISNLIVKVGDIYTKEGVQEALKSVFAMGYFSPRLKAIPTTLEDGNISLKIVVEENVPITDFTIEGNSVVSSGDILEVLQPIVGSPQNIDEINQVIAEVEELYASRGYILARVIAINDDPDGVINIEIDEGTINSVKFEGNKKTKDFVVERNILTKPGEIYNENLIKQDLMRLYGTQAFKNVTRTIERSEDNPDAYDVTINLEEQRTGTISIGAGIDTVTGLFGTAGFSDNNFRGTGQRVGINAMMGTGVVNTDSTMLNRANLQAEISWFEPHFRKSDTSLMIRAFGRDFASYQIPLAIERRFGLEGVLAREFKSIPNLIGSIGLTVEHVGASEGDEKQMRRLLASHNIPWSERKNQLEGGFFTTLSPSLTYDTRDDLNNPRHGVYGNLRFDEALCVSDFSHSFGKLTGSIKKYYPIAKKSSFSIMGRAGGKLYGNMPEVMAYRLGGPYTVRGFQMSGVGTGSGFMMASGELRVPVPFVDKIKDGQIKFLNDLRIAMFVDAGKVMNGTITNKIYNRPESAISAGVGLRIFIPGIGPLSLDWGYPITGTDSTGWSKGKFTFGVGEFY